MKEYSKTAIRYIRIQKTVSTVTRFLTVRVRVSHFWVRDSFSILSLQLYSTAGRLVVSLGGRLPACYTRRKFLADVICRTVLHSSTVSGYSQNRTWQHSKHHGHLCGRWIWNWYHWHSISCSIHHFVTKQQSLEFGKTLLPVSCDALSNCVTSNIWFCVNHQQCYFRERERKRERKRSAVHSRERELELKMFRRTRSE